MSFFKRMFRTNSDPPEQGREKAGSYSSTSPNNSKQTTQTKVTTTIQSSSVKPSTVTAGRKDSTQTDKLMTSQPKEAMSQTSTSTTASNEPKKTQPITSTADKNLTKEKLESLLKIQRFARAKIAQKQAELEQSWKIFAGLDTIEEAEMLQLATFMQTLLDRVPNSGQAPSTKGPQLDEDDEEVNEIINVENIELEGLTPGTKVTRKSFDFGTNKSAPLDISVAEGIIEVCRQGGKLSSNTVMKLLRRTYAMLKTFGNTRRIAVPPGGKLTVVGDLHGQLPDLIHILDEAGLPSPTNKFIFNGDFVDRGDNGVEITCILMALALAAPESVVLNRGNHEDAAITRVYGFQDECIEKYDELTYGMFSEVFRYLPLFVLINESIFVVHGGLFNNRAVSLADLDKINRTDYVARPPVPYPQCLEGLDNEGQWVEYYKQLQRDALWSDPQFEAGLVESERGAGVCFGPDVSKTFMENNGLSMIIRSHECVRRGFHLPYVPTSVPTLNPPNTPLLATIFSASNYGDGDNEGAYMVIMDHKHTDAAPIKNTGLYYSVHHYKTSESKISTIGPEKSHKSSLMELILKKKPALSVAFEVIDTEHKGVVTRAQWAEVMQRVTTVKIRWLALLTSIAPKDSITPTTVNYRLFLDNYTVKLKTADTAAKTGTNTAMLDSIYAQRKKLQAVFNFFDTNGDGVISPEEFRTGCAVLNEHLPEKQRLTDIDHMLNLMDFDGNGMVDVNEFFETFRILDEKFK